MAWRGGCSAPARRDAEELGRLERSLAIQATPEGVSLIRTGKLDKPATAAARRLAEQAREEIVEYLAGQRAFFSVPVDLSGTPDFQRRVLEAAQRHPLRRGPPVCVDRRAHRPSARGARGGHGARAESGAAHRAVPPRVAQRRRARRLSASAGG